MGVQQPYVGREDGVYGQNPFMDRDDEPFYNAVKPIPRWESRREIVGEDSLFLLLKIEKEGERSRVMQFLRRKGLTISKVEKKREIYARA